MTKLIGGFWLFCALVFVRLRMGRVATYCALRAIANEPRDAFFKLRLLAQDDDGRED